jgi:hypothetical protein
MHMLEGMEIIFQFIFIFASSSSSEGEKFNYSLKSTTKHFLHLLFYIFNQRASKESIRKSLFKLSSM